MRYFLLILLTGLAATSATAAPSETPISHIVVVGPADAETLGQERTRLALATKELATYLGRMSGHKVPTQPPGKGVRAKTVFVVGNAEQNRLAGALVEQKLVDLTLPSDHRDAFVVRYGNDGKHDYLVFAGANSLGTLYAVYHYLEKCCYLGTFMDGEHVPSRKRVPVEGIDIAETPRFRDRDFSYSVCYGMKKYFNQFRTADEMNEQMNWLVKRKMNRTAWGFWAYPGGVESGNVFGYECKPEEDYGAGWPRAWTLAPEYRTQMLQDWFSYSRERGIDFIYYIDYGLVPKPYRDKHPDLPYVEHLGYGSNTLRPDSPECLTIMNQYLTEIMRLYGTDHIYQCTPYVESTGAASPDESLALKTNAAKNLCSVLEQIDPDFIWQSDSWDFGAVPSVWTPERTQKYFDDLAPQHPRMYIYDTAGVANPFYRRTDFFGGVDWAFGILHSFQGDDHLHGDIPRVLQAVRDAANDPGSTNLKGLYHIPESSGHNILFFQFTSELTWDPNEVEIDSFLEHYCHTRYNAKSYGPMLACTRKVLDAVYTGGGLDMYYQRMGITYNPAVSPPFDDYKGFASQYSELCREIPLLEEAVQLALNARRTEKGNKLYENDLVVYTKTMLGLKSNYYIIEAYKAFKERDKETFESNAGNALKCLNGIEAILSTRPDYSIQQTIDDAMAIPGTNPFLPRMVRKHAINDMYAPVDNYEQLVLFYRPRVESYFDAMRTHISNGVSAFSRGEMNETFGAQDSQWWDNDCRVSDEKRFKGTTVQAVCEVYDCVPLGTIEDKGSIELKADQALQCAPASASALTNFAWEDGQVLTREVEGKTVWTLGTGQNNQYLYFSVDALTMSDCKEPVVFTIDYLDEGAGQLQLHYDSREAIWKNTTLADLTGSGQWKTATVTLADAVFTKRQHTFGDFRLHIAGGPAAIGRVIVSSPHVTALPTFDVVKGNE